MVNMTARLSDGTEINNVQEVVEGTSGVHLKQKVEGGGIERSAYIPFPQLDYVYYDN